MKLEANETQRLTAFNPYIVTWAVLIPQSGIVTQKDNKTIRGSNMGKYCIRHFPTYELALMGMSKLKDHLSKRYECFFITDKQYGLVVNNFRLSSNIGNVYRIATKIQIENTIII